MTNSHSGPLQGSEIRETCLGLVETLLMSMEWLCSAEAEEEETGCIVLPGIIKVLRAEEEHHTAYQKCY